MPSLAIPVLLTTNFPVLLSPRHNYWCLAFELAIDDEAVPEIIDDKKIITVELNDLLKGVDLLMRTKFSLKGEMSYRRGLYKNMCLPHKEDV